MEVIDKYFQDSLRFTEASPRPPIPGEENEITSNGGHSSASIKTASSDKSLKSKSPAATPRRSNLDKNVSSQVNVEGDEAPLGYEPEGMAENKKSGDDLLTPPYRKWAENFEYLLDDREGLNLFKIFLEQEHSVLPLDFCFACRGIKIAQEEKVLNLAKVIYKKFIKGDVLQLQPKVKRLIASKLQSREPDRTMFDDAQSFVEESMRTNLYPLFLNSDVYVQYVQNGGESPKSSLSTSGSSSARPMSTTLCTLHENSELRHEDLQADDLTFSSINQSTVSNPSTVLSLNSTNLVATQVARNPSAGRVRVPPRERYAPATTNPTYVRASCMFALVSCLVGLCCTDPTSACRCTTTRTCRCRSATARTRATRTPTTPCPHTPTAACKSSPRFM